MKTTIKSKAVSTKNHIVRHRAKYAAAATLVGCYAVHRKAVIGWYAFLAEKGIDQNEFLLPEFLETLNA